MSPVTWALSSWVCKYADDLVPAAKNANFSAVEWDLNFLPIPLSTQRLFQLRKRFEEHHISVRYHLPYSTCDPGSKNERIRHISQEYLQLNIEQISHLGGNYCVLHFACTETDTDPPLDALRQLVETGNKHGVTIGIENLMQGPTNNPSLLRAIALECGCSIVLDTGHARDVDTLVKYLDLLGPIVTHVHFYGSEDARRNHLPFANNRDAARVAAQIRQNCSANWWTCEMDDIQHCIRTRAAAETNL